MILYLNAISKNNIGYTPDSLIIDNKVYDIQGDIDYSTKGLSCRVKGDLFIEKDNEYCLMNKKEERRLLELLRSSKEITVAIYPVDENATGIKDDELIDCEGEIFINLLGKEIKKKFNFITECYF